MPDVRLRNILALSKSEKQKFLDSFDLVLSDCDGVLWLIIGSIPKSGTALNLLTEAGKKCHLVSNNSVRTDDEYRSNLKEMGVRNRSEIQIITPAKTTVNYLKKMQMEKPVYTLAGDNFNNELQQAGFEVLQLENKVYPNLEVFANDLVVKERAGAVIFDVDINLNVPKLDKAYKYLQDPDCVLMVGACDAVLPLKKDLTVIGPVHFIDILKRLSGKTPLVLGKPGVLLADYLCERFNIVQPQRTLFIGDNLVQDVEFGLRNDFQTLLVLTGASSAADARRSPNDKQPHYVANSIADFIDFFADLDSK